MSHAKNKVEWCLRKAMEVKEGEKHRGLVKTKPNLEQAHQNILKAEHYLKATDYLKKGNYSDISASTAFYAMYQSLLAITAKFGYESMNQECTFALIGSLIEDKEIDFDQEMLNKIASLDVNTSKEQTTLDIREEYQYGTSLSLKDDLYKKLFELAKNVISKAKVIVEE